MEGKSRFRCGLIALALVGILAALVTPPLFAQAVMPEGATITQANFSIFAQNDTGQTVYAHRILTDWGEGTVTWDSFGGNFDPDVVGSFIAAFGWNSVDVTPLVQAWVDGDVPNFGILLEQPSSDLTRYWSSEFEIPEYRPILEIWYTSPSGVDGYVLIQRPDVAQDGVKDAYVSELFHTYNGNGRTIGTGLFEGWKKYSLIHFLFIVEPPDEGPGTGTPGYFKKASHWPAGVDEIEVGSRIFPQDEAITYLKRNKRNGNKCLTMFNGLVAAKLNVINGAVSWCVDDTISDADAWFGEWCAPYELLSNPLPASEPAWGDVGQPLHWTLDDYNNGLLCAPHRD